MKVSFPHARLPSFKTLTDEQSFTTNKLKIFPFETLWFVRAIRE
ncbi:hypothetical protein [Trichocoleus sp. DQ-A2]